MFVQMSLGEQQKSLFHKILCAQCLEAGMRFDENHNCSKIYSCQDTLHKKFKNGLHVLVCAHHRDTKENQKLLKREVMDKYSNLEKFKKNINISSYGEVDGTHVTESVLPVTDVDVNDSTIFQLLLRLGINS